MFSKYRLGLSNGAGKHKHAELQIREAVKPSVLFLPHNPQPCRLAIQRRTQATRAIRNRTNPTRSWNPITRNERIFFGQKSKHGRHRFVRPFDRFGDVIVTAQYNIQHIMCLRYTRTSYPLRVTWRWRENAFTPTPHEHVFKLTITTCYISVKTTGNRFDTKFLLLCAPVLCTIPQELISRFHVLFVETLINHGTDPFIRNGLY